jgi:K+/H+ antiporter YhaU regulatory subunit KhtT
MFSEKFRDTPVLTRQAIYNLNQRFQGYGSMHDLPTSIRPRTSLTDENLTTVAQVLVKSSKKIIRTTSEDFIIPSTNQCLLNCGRIENESVPPSSFADAKRRRF